VLDVRWWRVDDLVASAEIVEPLGILVLARRLLAGEIPAEPVDLGLLAGEIPAPPVDFG
jgi:hypothetical protein